MSTPAPSASAATPAPAWLDEHHLELIAAALDASSAPFTRAAYASAWRRWAT